MGAESPSERSLRDDALPQGLKALRPGLKVRGFHSLPLLLTLSLILSTLVSSRAAAQDIPTHDRQSRDIRVGVLGLFKTTQFTVSAPTGSALLVHAGHESIVLERSSGLSSIRVRLSGNTVVIDAGAHAMRASAITMSGRGGRAADFVLTIPSKISRHYRGTLEIKPEGSTLMAVVAMTLETLVASVVAAESASDAPFEALKAQAVAARSYALAGRGRHKDFDFCDTTHCQFLREPPAPEALFFKAVEATRGLVLTYASHPFAAMYTRSCGGHTHTPSELGMGASAYPYYSVECKHCREHPVRWSSRISADDAATLHSSNEGSRLRLARRLGWSVVPSNDFVMRREDADADTVVLEGIGHGHGIGLCQAGANAMAKDGADYLDILRYYYPNTTVTPNW